MILDDVIERIDLPDDDAAATVRGRSAGTLGDLTPAAEWAAAVQGSASPRAFAHVRLISVTGDSGRQSLASHIAAHSGSLAAVRRITLDDLERSDIDAAVNAGISIADHEADAGTDLLIIGSSGVDDDVAASAVIGLLSARDASAVTGVHVDDTTWMSDCAAIRDAMRQGRASLGEPVAMLADLRATEIALLTGMLIGAAARRTPVILDGLGSIAAALVAQRLAYRARRWQAAVPFDHVAHAIAVDRLEPLMLAAPRTRIGDGTGGLLALPALQAAATLAVP